MGILDLDLNAVTDPNEVAPAGTYDLRIKKAEDKVYDSGAEGVSIQLQIQGEGEHAGKIVFENVIYKNKDGGLNRFGAFRMKQYFAAAKAKKADTTLLTDVELRAEIGVQEAGDYPASNNVKRILL